MVCGATTRDALTTDNAIHVATAGASRWHAAARGRTIAAPTPRPWISNALVRLYHAETVDGVYRNVLSCALHRPERGIRFVDGPAGDRLHGGVRGICRRRHLSAAAFPVGRSIRPWARHSPSRDMRALPICGCIGLARWSGERLRHSSFCKRASRQAFPCARDRRTLVAGPVDRSGTIAP